jgi:hypothetical protein
MQNSTRWLQDKTAVVLSSSERRSAPRFPLQLRVRYRLSGRSHDPGRVGVTLDISSGGMLIKPQCEGSSRVAPALVVYEPLEVILDWPFFSSETNALKFVAKGRVVRYDTVAFAISIERYQLWTVRAAYAKI